MKNFNLYYRMLLSSGYIAWLRLSSQFTRTLLGTAWIGLSLIITISILGCIYGTLTGVSDWSSYWIYAALGILCWNAIATSISNSCSLLERSRDRLLNQNLPLNLFIIEEWFYNCFSFLIGFIMIFFLLLFLKPLLLSAFLSGGWLGLVNILLGCLIFSLVVSPLALLFPDICQLTPIFLQISFLASPILFDRQSLGSLYWVSNLNPLYLWIRISREPFIGNLNLGLQISFLISQLVFIFIFLWLIDKLQMILIRRI